MNTLKIKNVVLGEGKPKICVSIIGQTKDEILEQARKMKDTSIDVVEWRVDWFKYVYDLEKVKDVAKDLADILVDMPLLFTFRTSKEGGECSIEDAYYCELNKEISKTGYVDLIDIEAFTGDDLVMDIISFAHKNSVKVVASNHDFDKTPSKDDIIYRLRKMQDLGADVPKIAVMPKSKLDVLELLEATVIMSENYADRPIITMSMSGNGVVSRLAGEIFGSALTFGALGKASAPGQIEVDDLENVLNILNKSI